VERLILTQDRIAADSLELEEPWFRVRREKDGAIQLPWFRLGGGEEGEAAQPGGEAAATTPAPTITLGHAKVTGLRADWVDDVLDPPLESRVGSTFELKDVSIARGGFECGGSVGVEFLEIGGRIDVEGRVRLTPEEELVEVELAGRGLKPGPIDRYAGGQVVIDFRDGRLGGTIRAERKKAPEGGNSASLTVKDLFLRDGEAGPPLLAARDLRVKVDRFDEANRILEVDQVVARGTVLEIRTETTGGTRIGGLLFPKAAPREVSAAPEARGPETVEEFRERLRAILEERRPLVRLKTLDLAIQRLAITSGQEGTPLVFEDFTLRNVKPLEALGEDVADHPGLEFRVEGKISPIAESVVMEASATPFSNEPELDFQLEVKGIEPSHWAGLTEDDVDLSRLRGASIVTRGRAQFRMRRENPFSYPISRPFSGEVALEEFRLSGADGNPLFAFDEFRIVAPSIDLGRSSFRLRRVELSAPRFDALRDEEGLHVAGVLIRLPKDEAADEKAAPAKPSPAGESAGPEFHLTLENLHVQDVETVFTSSLGDPETVIPLSDLEVAVRGFSTRAFDEPLPVTFSVGARSAPVELPLKPPREREAFRNLEIAGRLTLTEVRDGWVKVDLGGLELSNFLGMAGEKDIQLRGGTFDLDGRWRFQGQDATLDVRLELTFTDLDVSEARGGPIERILRLPASLNTAIFVLRDESGRIRFPLEYTVSQTGDTVKESRDKAIHTFGILVANALKSAPLRLAGIAVDVLAFTGSLVGIQRGKEEEILEEPPVVLEFAAGDSSLSVESRNRLDRLVKRLAKDGDLFASLDHELGKRDVAILDDRTNPDPEDCRDIITFLRIRKQRLYRARSQSRARMRAAIATGANDDFQKAVDELRSLDRRSAAVEADLDDMLDVLRAPETGRRKQRTREACLGLAQARLRALHEDVGEAASSLGGQFRFRRPRFQDPKLEGGGRVVITLGRVKD
jgi:hypothetical protein